MSVDCDTGLRGIVPVCTLFTGGCNFRGIVILTVSRIFCGIRPFGGALCLALKSNTDLGTSMKIKYIYSTPSPPGSLNLLGLPSIDSNARLR